MVKRILFVCTGNTCRSPLAEGLFRHLARSLGVEAEARSAGVMASDGMPISAQSKRILEARGIIDSLISSSVDGETVHWADLILTMTANHKNMVVQQYPHAMDKVFTLKEFVEDDPQAREKWAAWEEFVAEMQMKLALSHPVTEEDRKRAQALEYQLPDSDVADPFGGPLELYEQCAVEIEELLIKLLQKIKSEL